VTQLKIRVTLRVIITIVIYDDACSGYFDQLNNNLPRILELAKFISSLCFILIIITVLEHHNSASSIVCAQILHHKDVFVHFSEIFLTIIWIMMIKLGLVIKNIWLE
jgi:hypothetical protein